MKEKEKEFYEEALPEDFPLSSRERIQAALSRAEVEFSIATESKPPARKPSPFIRWALKRTVAPMRSASALRRTAILKFVGSIYVEFVSELRRLMRDGHYNPRRAGAVEETFLKKITMAAAAMKGKGIIEEYEEFDDFLWEVKGEVYNSEEHHRFYIERLEIFAHHLSQSRVLPVPEVVADSAHTVTSKDVYPIREGWDPECHAIVATYFAEVALVTGTKPLVRTLCEHARVDPSDYHKWLRGEYKRGKGTRGQSIDKSIRRVCQTEKPDLSPHKVKPTETI